MKYGLVMKFKVGDVYTKVREFEDSINGFMHGCGFQETMFLQSEAPIMVMEIDKVLTPQEEADVVRAMNQVLAEHDKIDMECVGIERQE